MFLKKGPPLSGKSQSFELHQREREGIRILDLRGPLTGGDAEAQLRHTIIALADAGSRNFIFNLSEVDKIDNDGLSALLCCKEWSAKSGGALKFANVRADLNVEVVTQLASFFEIFVDEADALNSFFPDRVLHGYDILEWVQKQRQKHPLFQK